MIHGKDWEFCNTDDIGPLEYANDYHNGGGILSFKYIIGTDTLVVSSKGIYSPYCYQLHSGGRKNKHTGLFYKFNVNGETYYCSKDDAMKCLPDFLPEEYVIDSNKITNIDNTIDDFINNIYLFGKHITIVENEMDNSDNIIDFNIVTTDTNQIIFSFIKYINNSFIIKFYKEDKVLSTTIIRDKYELTAVIANIADEIDFNEYTNELKEICNTL